MHRPCTGSSNSGLIMKLYFRESPVCPQPYSGVSGLSLWVIQVKWWCRLHPGPLIRIIGDRFTWQVKAAILQTLGLLIAKAGPGLKPFVPQLQTTFLKCLADQVQAVLNLASSDSKEIFCPNLNRAWGSRPSHLPISGMQIAGFPAQARPVRQSAAVNLGELTKMSMRVDQLATDLANNARTAEPALREAYLTALRGMLASVGGRLSPPVLSSTGAALQEMMAGAGGCHIVLFSFFCMQCSPWLITVAG